MIANVTCRAGLLLMCLGFSAFPVSAGDCAAEWSPLGPVGADDTVYAFAEFDDGTGPALYAGGRFTQAGDSHASLIAKWDGFSWSALGEELADGFNDEVNALVVFDDGNGPALYAGGRFSEAGGVPVSSNVARWDGSSWSAVGGMSSEVRALMVFDDGSGPALFVGVRSGTVQTGVLRWDGSSWTTLGAGLRAVNALCVFDDGSGPSLYAGGWFTESGGDPMNHIARWDGNAWTPLGAGVNRPIYSLAVFDDGGGAALYAGGGFWEAGGNPAYRIARWDGSSWSPVGDGLDSNVYSITVFDDGGHIALYAGGEITMTGGGDPIHGIARWDGKAWSQVGDGLSTAVHSVVVADDGNGPALFAGGTFIAEPCGRLLHRTARWGCVRPWACVGDINFDGQVDLQDLNLVLANFGDETFCGDTNGDGTVGLDDLNSVLAQFGSDCP